jgi:hypothetical protein
MKTATTDEVDIDFLSEELNIAFSMLRIAQSDAGTNPTDCQSALATAREALGTIRRLEGRIEDTRAWRGIHARANELKSAITAFIEAGATTPDKALSAPPGGRSLWARPPVG